MLRQTQWGADMCRRIGSGRGSTSQQVQVISMKQTRQKNEERENNDRAEMSKHSSTHVYVYWNSQRRSKLVKGEGKSTLFLWSSIFYARVLKRNFYKVFNILWPRLITWKPNKQLLNLLSRTEPWFSCLTLESFWLQKSWLQSTLSG